MLALVEAVFTGADFADPWAFVNGDVVVGADLTLIGVERHLNGSSLRLRRSGTGQLLDYFEDAGTYPDAKLFIVVDDSNGDPVHIPLSHVNSGGGFSNWSIDDSSQSTLISGIESGGRFVIAIAEPTPIIPALEITPDPIDGDLLGELAGSLALAVVIAESPIDGDLPGELVGSVALAVVIAPPPIEGDLPGELVGSVALPILPIEIAPRFIFGLLPGDITAVLSLGQPPPLEVAPLAAPIDGDLLGELVGSVALGGAPGIPLVPSVIDGVLLGEITATLDLGKPRGRLTEAFLRSAFRPETDEVWLILLTLSHPDLTDDIRVVHNPETITSRGQDYIGFAFDLTLPSDTEDRAPVAELRIDNVSREIAQAVRSISSAPAVTIEIIRAADPDIVEISLTGFTLRNARWDALAVSGSLALDDISIEPYPAGSFTPASFPGLF